jgi:hypothetical protein
VDNHTDSHKGLYLQMVPRINSDTEEAPAPCPKRVAVPSAKVMTMRLIKSFLPTEELILQAALLKLVFR